MHAAKRLLAMQSPGDDFPANYDQSLELSKNRLRQSFLALARADGVFSSMFRLHHLLGVGSFGMVMQAEAVVDIAAKMLVGAQDGKCQAEAACCSTGQMWIQRRQRHLLRPEEIILRRGDKVAVKFEYNVDKQRRKFQLVKEHNLLVELFNCYDDKLEGFPEPYLFGCLGGATFTDASVASRTARYHCYHFLVMELLGENLRPRFDDAPASKQPDTTAFPVAVAFDVARQLLTRLMLLHTAPISATHNDLKLDQLMLGRNEKRHIVYLVDFGLSLKYKRGTRIGWGNRRYSSRFRHEGVNSPLTDLESVAYIVARFLHNEFPWDGLQCSDSAKKHKISAIKCKLWRFVEYARQGQCLPHELVAWPRRFFADRTDADGRGGPELLKFMSKLNECASGKAGNFLPAEAIDYNYLFNCFYISDPS